MRAELGGLIAATLVAACSAKNVDLGRDAELEHSGMSAGDTAAGGMSSANGGAGHTGGETMSAGGETMVPAACGDGYLDRGEACDDGNSRSGDGCSASCNVEPGWACSSGVCGWICGDHLVIGPEQCVMGECPSPGAVAAPAAPGMGRDPAPCDIYAADGAPCVAAHSTARALYATYDGPLYRVQKGNGNVLDIPPFGPGGLANAPLQNTFCAGSACTISIIYDQSGHGNHLRKAPAGGAKSSPGNEANADGVAAILETHPVYGVHIVPGVAYRNNNACGTATADDAETEYEVVAGDFYNGGCCFDYGNVERDSQNHGAGAAEAIYFGSSTIWGEGAGLGPWVMGDLENGLWPGNVTPYAGNESLSFKYVTAFLKGDAAGKNHWTIKAGNAQKGSLKTLFDGPRPNVRYNPMKKQGGITLGAAGDNSSGAQGNFFEGVMTTGYSSDEADAAVQANIVQVYGAE